MFKEAVKRIISGPKAPPAKSAKRDMETSTDSSDVNFEPPGPSTSKNKQRKKKTKSPSSTKSKVQLLTVQNGSKG